MTLQGSDHPKLQGSCFLLRAGEWEREEHIDVIGELALSVDSGFVGIMFKGYVHFFICFRYYIKSFKVNTSSRSRYFCFLV